ncbi:unnamed protein product, partial [Didymodactylos carnosus]
MISNKMGDHSEACQLQGRYRATETATAAPYTGNGSGKAGLYGDKEFCSQLARCNDVMLVFANKSECQIFKNYFGEEKKCERITTILHKRNTSFELCSSSHKSLYSMEMLYSLGFIFEDKYNFSTKLQQSMNDLTSRCDNTFYQLTLNAYKELKQDHCLDLTKIFNEEKFKEIQNELLLDNDQQQQQQQEPIYYQVGHLCVTPMRILVLPMETIMGHRILRRKDFGGKENFIIVDFKDEQVEKYLNDSENLKSYYRDHILKRGIDLCLKKYFLIGASNSQIKDKSFWFYQCQSNDDIALLLQRLAEFQKITNLGTYVSRVGLWFTKTKPTEIKLEFYPDPDEFNTRVKQSKHCVTLIDDIIHDTYNFTDGNGLISRGLAQLIESKNLFEKKSSSAPSAYQIRIAGCKGLVIIDPQSTLNEFYIKVRKSMYKVDSDDGTLDICENGFSAPVPTSLNNQIIILLSDLGVPDDTFFDIQQQYFQRLQASSNEEYQIMSLDDIKKNKYPLPENECRYMFGCSLDSPLKPNQCFIRYEILDKGQPTNEFRCVTGKVIITKNPCPYAGDMIVLEAVDLPELYCQTNVIVFPVVGTRPHFNECGGSDLDGDCYWAYWGSKFKIEPDVPPLKYTSAEKSIHPTIINAYDVISYVIALFGASSY